MLKALINLFYLLSIASRQVNFPPSSSEEISDRDDPSLMSNPLEALITAFIRLKELEKALKGTIEFFKSELSSERSNGGGGSPSNNNENGVYEREVGINRDGNRFSNGSGGEVGNYGNVNGWLRGLPRNDSPFSDDDSASYHSATDGDEGMVDRAVRNIVRPRILGGRLKIRLEIQLEIWLPVRVKSMPLMTSELRAIIEETVKRKSRKGKKQTSL